MQGTGTQSVGTVASVSKAFASNLTAGSLLSVHGIASTADMPASGGVTDTLGNTYARDIIIQRGANERAALFSSVAGSAGACTVTLDCTGSDFQSIVVSEYAPTAGNSWDTVAANRLDDTGSASDSTTSSMNVLCGNVVTGASGVVVGVMTQGGANTAITPVSPWIEIFEDEDATDMPVNSVYRITTASTYAPAWTLGGGRAWTCAGAGYKETAGGAASGGVLQRAVAQGWI